MGEIAQTRPELTRRPVLAAVSATVSSLLRFAGLLITVAALAVAAGLAVVFAATLALVMVLASVLLGLSVVALRMQRRSLLQGARLRARAGHGWVAYDWNRPL